MGGFSSAMDQLRGMGINTLIGSTARTSEEQKKLHDDYLAGKGGIAAAPGTSKHELGLGIDIYSDSKFSPPTQEQIAAMEANGWKHMNIPGDLGHFEYVGKGGKQNGTYSPAEDPNLKQVGSNAEGGLFQDSRTGQTITGTQAAQLYGTPAQSGPTEPVRPTAAQEAQFRTYNGNNIPEEYKTPSQKTAFVNAFTQWSNAGHYTKDQKADQGATYDDIIKEPVYKQYAALRPKATMINDITKRLDEGTATAQDKQQLISDFAKILDPDSVVREGEYALAGKYSQSKLESMAQEVKNFFTTNGPLSNDAAKMLSSGLKGRFDSIAKEYDDIIDEKLKGLKLRSGMDLSPEVLGLKYSSLRENSQTPSVDYSQNRFTQGKGRIIQ